MTKMNELIERLLLYKLPDDVAGFPPLKSDLLRAANAIGALMTENTNLRDAIALMDQQVVAGEGVGILHYFENGVYRGWPSEENPRLAEYCRELLGLEALVEQP